MDQSKQRAERFVDGEVVARYLDVPRREVLRLSRQGLLRSYCISGRVRKKRKFKMSEVDEDIAKLRDRPKDEPKMDDSSPSDPEQDDKHE